MTETLTLTNTRDLQVALAKHLEPTMPKIYEQVVVVRGQGVSQLAVYAQRYIEAELRCVVDTLASEGLITNPDDDALALWDSHCRKKGWLTEDGGHWFPSARIDFPDATDLEPVPALPAPSITAAELGAIVSTAVDAICAAITADKPDAIVERDTAGQVTGVRRRRAN